ncbi:MAG: 4-hydroxy-tetrahydrodipicolinate synthase [Clostridiales bacterium]|nr:4-hydroxy-tetrahydrodipicolinate synthase [Clostridiales bacterium]MDD7387801.1 4-hydroxy-tetrahydrodipicolinate synthase [Bacillota bacterium]MDY6041866.1 4-hydroxy-tetrahydrodipicolinate synthase [Candidatus Faecousia sp.]
MNHPIFTGMATAMVTPMHADGSVDFEALGRFIDFQLASGINALVAVGTSGESATLEPSEQKEVIRFTVERVAGRVPVIAGTGTNNTAHVLENTKNACQVGASAVLVVTPYYNKATQSGLIAHFTAIADASDVPVILYNVPGRTGCNLLPKTVAVLAEHPNIAAIKEATGNMAQMVELRALCGDKLDIYSGEDALTVPMMAMGAKGTISVLSNVVPREAVAMTDAALAGNFQEAARLQCKLLKLTNALFSQVNPIPVKAAVSAMGFGEEHLRLPLTPMEEPLRSAMFAELRALGVNV